MCACEPGFTCVSCLDTPQDDRYEEDERPELYEPHTWTRVLADAS